MQLSLDGKELGKPIDGFNADKVVAPARLSWARSSSKKGAATLRIEVTGGNEKAVSLKTMFGLDCVLKKRGIVHEYPHPRPRAQVVRGTPC